LANTPRPYAVRAVRPTPESAHPEESRVSEASPEVPSDRPHFAVWPRRLPRALVIPETSLWVNIEVTARRYPDKPAYLFFGRPLTYRQLHAQAEAIAGWLQGVGVAAGDRVAIYLQNCPQFAVAYYGVLRANAVVVPVNPMNRADEFEHYITDPGTKVVICAADLAGIVATANAAVPAAQRVSKILVTQYTDAMPDVVDPAEAAAPAIDAWLRAEHPLPPGAVRWRDVLAQRLAPGPHTAQPDDLAMLPYTSGTTGLPKGCMHTHRTLMSNTVAGAWGYGGGPEPVGLAVVPMFHITGILYGVLGPAYTGATLVLMPRWDRELAGRLISRHRISHWTCIPTMIIDLFGSPNYRSFDLSSLRALSGGGAANPPPVAQPHHADISHNKYDG
jgi:fatty-acyl-CoA synthase